jgi:hypothetical protein
MARPFASPIVLALISGAFVLPARGAEERPTTPGRPKAARPAPPASARPAGSPGASAAAPARRAVRPSSFRITLGDAGAYRIGYQDLVRAGGKGPFRSAGLGMKNQGKPVPIWVHDGGDGLLGEGDWVEFVGEILPGENAFYNEYTNRNVYMLSTGQAAPARMKRRPPPLPAVVARPPLPLDVKRHLEEDQVLLRLVGNQGLKQELWHWAKLTQIDTAPFEVPLDLSDLDTSSERPVRIRLDFRGWSMPAARPTPDTKDHAVEVSINGRVVGSTEWNNADQEHQLDLPEMPASSLQPGPLTVQIRVPARPGAQGTDSLVDVSMLNWVQVEYPRVARVPATQVRVHAVGDNAAAALTIASDNAKALVVYGDDGSRWNASSFAAVEGMLKANPARARRFDLVFSGGYLRPASVVKDQPSRLKSVAHQADYIMVAHERLRAAVEPLAAYHRSAGLKVDVVDIQDVYDEFNNGILHPRALKDFLSYAYHKWKKPSPRFVLLVGDASWDSKNERANEDHYPASTFSPAHGTLFSGIDAIPYEEGAALNHRNLVPTWSYLTYDGHAAGDNWFVSVDGEDKLPDMAIGRFTAVDAAEVEAIVQKTITYATQADWSDWRRRILWITSEQLGFQHMSDGAAEVAARMGFDPDKVYPPANSTTAEDQARLRSALNKGQLLVHFVGHGGRYIWRTGPADWQQHRDLFNLDDIDALDASSRLPMVLSMTCYSAPFDHPSADSIGEKFLRVPGKGAVAVLAASWRNAPYQAMSTDVIDELVKPGAPTIGEAIQRVKRAGRHHEFIEQYNLLGDPALKLAVPRLRLDLAASHPSGEPPMVTGVLDAPRFKGQAEVDWLDAKGAIVQTEKITVEGPRFRAVRPKEAQNVTSVRIYAWDADSRLDGLGKVSLEGAPPSGQGVSTP